MKRAWAAWAILGLTAFLVAWDEPSPTPPISAIVGAADTLTNADTTKTATTSFPLPYGKPHFGIASTGKGTAGLTSRVLYQLADKSGVVQDTATVFVPVGGDTGEKGIIIPSNRVLWILSVVSVATGDTLIVSVW